MGEKVRAQKLEEGVAWSLGLLLLPWLTRGCLFQGAVEDKAGGAWHCLHFQPLRGNGEGEEVGSWLSRSWQLLG